MEDEMMNQKFKIRTEVTKLRVRVRHIKSRLKNEACLSYPDHYHMFAMNLYWHQKYHEYESRKPSQYIRVFRSHPGRVPIFCDPRACQEDDVTSLTANNSVRSPKDRISVISAQTLGGAGR